MILIGNDTLNDPALLIDTGLASTGSGAFTHVQRLLPKPHLNRSEMNLLHDWFELSGSAQHRQCSGQSCKSCSLSWGSTLISGIFKTLKEQNTLSIFQATPSPHRVVFALQPSSGFAVLGMFWWLSSSCSSCAEFPFCSSARVIQGGISPCTGGEAETAKEQLWNSAHCSGLYLRLMSEVLTSIFLYPVLL